MYDNLALFQYASSTNKYFSNIFFLQYENEMKIIKWIGPKGPGSRARFSDACGDVSSRALRTVGGQKMKTSEACSTLRSSLINFLLMLLISTSECLYLYRKFSVFFPFLSHFVSFCFILSISFYILLFFYLCFSSLFMFWEARNPKHFLVLFPR